MLFRFKDSAKKMHVLIGFESCFNTDKELAQVVDIMMAEGIYISLIKDKQKKNYHCFLVFWRCLLESFNQVLND